MLISVSVTPEVAADKAMVQSPKDDTSGYTTNMKCSNWSEQGCSVSKKPMKKDTSITGDAKEPREVCAPAGCGFKQGTKEC